MKNLILVALDDRTRFWYECAISFFISLKETNYKGDIGVISYDLSERKKEILKNNNILIFDAPKKYSQIFIDRQYAVYEIGKKYGYDQIALYDGDIWFPSKELTIFDQIKNKDKLYCCTESRVGNFIFKSTKENIEKKVRKAVSKMIEEKSGVWQVGVIVGTLKAWKKYVDYLEKIFSEDNFNFVYGIDTTAMILYSYDTNNIIELHIKYNCLISSGLVDTNINSKKQILEHNIFTVNNKIVEGIHITGRIREYYQNYHNYFEVYDYKYDEGRKYKLETTQFVEINKQLIINLYEKMANKNWLELKLEKIVAESNVDVEFKGDISYIKSSGIGMILKNPHDRDISFDIATLPELGYARSRFIRFSSKDKIEKITLNNEWLEIVIKKGESIQLSSYDLDVENSKLNWCFKGIKLI